MTSDQLMQQAKQIETAAAEAEYRQLVTRYPRGAHLIDRAEIEARYQNRVQPLFEPFAGMPDPASYDGVIDELYSAMGYLSHGAHVKDPITKQTVGANRDLSAIDSAADELVDWVGEGAQKFKVNFLDPFPDVATNQFLILGILKGTAQADQAMWRGARTDIDEIAKATLHALENVGSCGKNDVKFTISVIGTVAAITAIPFTAGASAVVAGVGAAASAAGTVQQGMQEVKGSGGSAEQVVQSMGTAIDELTTQIRDKQAQIAKTLSAYAGEASRGKGSPPTPFVSARPKLAGMEGSGLISGEGVGRQG